MAKRRWSQTWLALIVVAIGLVPTAIMGLFVYMSATATPLHPTPQDVTSVAGATVVGQWADAVEQARQIVRAGLSEQNVPGLSVAVGVGDDIVWAEGFGWADLETHEPVSPATRFRIGTASTPITSTAVGLLLERDRLNLDEKIQTYVPEFPEKQWPVTLRQVMAHTAGIRSDGGDEGPLFGVHCERPVEALQHFEDRPLLFEPGTQYRFSRFGFILVSAAIEAAAGEPFLTFMQKHIFEPLGMDDTRADTTTKQILDRATPYFPKFAADPRYGNDVMRPIDLSCYAGSSVFLSTPSDLVRFALAINSGTLLQPATVHLLQTPQPLPSGKAVVDHVEDVVTTAVEGREQEPEGTGYGLGWDLESVTVAGKETRLVGHDGDVLGGIVASLMLFPEHDIIVSVISNTSYADTPGIAVKIAQAFAASTR